MENKIAISVLNIVVLLLTLYMASNNEMLLRRKRRLISLVVITTIIVVAAECAANILDRQSADFSIPNILVNIIGFSLSPAIPILMAIAFDSEYRKGVYLPFIAVSLNALLVLLSPLTGFIFTITPDNEYIRGALFWIYIVSFGVGMAALLSVIMKSLRASYSKKKTLFLVFIFVVIGTATQTAFPQIHTTWLCVTFSIVFYYAFLCENNNKQDILTTLYNRLAYDSALKYFESSGRGVVVILDVDNFKAVNDTAGHSYGDYCLNKIGNLIRISFKGIGFGYRTGGDEFCVICENMTDNSVNKAVAEFITAISNIRKRDERFPAVSHGCCSFSPKKGGIYAAIEFADSNMYKYKANRNTAH